MSPPDAADAPEASPPPVVLVTRPEPEATALTERLAALGYTALSAPMLRIERLAHIAPEALAASDAVALTSRAAARLVGEDLAGAVCETPAYCVGDATADAARAAGFATVISAGADGKALAALLCRSLPRGAEVAAPQAEEAAFDLAAALRAAGRRVVETALYRAALVETMPPAAAEALRSGAVTAVLIFSARTALAFKRAAAGAPLGGATAVCISRRAAEVLTYADANMAEDDPARIAWFGRVVFSDQPTLPSLLGRLAATAPAPDTAVSRAP